MPNLKTDVILHLVVQALAPGPFKCSLVKTLPTIMKEYHQRFKKYVNLKDEVLDMTDLFWFPPYIPRRQSVNPNSSNLRKRSLENEVRGNRDDRGASITHMLLGDSWQGFTKKFPPQNYETFPNHPFWNISQRDHSKYCEFHEG